MTGLRVGRVRGIDIVVDASVLVLGAVVAWVLFIDLAITYPDADQGRSAVVAVTAAVAFLLAILAHELSHALVARSRNLRVRGIRLFVFGGYSVIESDGLRPQDEAAVSIAGPVASLVIAGTAWLTSSAVSDAVIERSLLALAIFNAAIAVFNLLPGFPLDGGRVLRALLWRRSGDRIAATRRAVQWGRILGLAVIGVGVFVAIRFGDLMGLLWVLLGWFLFRTAASAGRRDELMARVEGLIVGDVMRDVHEAVPGSMTVARVIELYQFGPRLRSMPVEIDGRIRGILGDPEIEVLSPGRRAASRASGAMTKIGPADVVDAATPLDEFLSRPSGRTRRAIVVDAGVVVGVVESSEMAELFAAVEAS